ncbi:GNAT family N-acetyltransferase [Clostridiales bacterium FE2010]|nr:GNAT family N-acetyltransferase [Clostridiales bacterium FE2010]
MKEIEIIDLTEEQSTALEDMLDEYDYSFIKFRLDGSVEIGIYDNGELIAGLSAVMTAFRIMYVSTVFVKEEYRRKGYGAMLMREMEKRAKALGANMIRLDTFDWQGKEFYEALGYQQVGHYTNEEDGFSEYFFLKRI